MSDVTTGSAFNPQFFMNPPWWIGRVEEKETWNDNIAGETFTSVADIEGWGHRYKVRVFNWHTGQLDKLPPKEMAFCQVVMPVTAGSGHGGASITPSIESGSVVFGFFMDGMAGQEGYIMGVLGNSNNNVPKKREDSLPSALAKPAPSPRSGPGSLAGIPVPPDVDRLSTDQLKKLLDPSKTPSSAVFRAAAEARQNYDRIQKINGLPINFAERERQALIATVKASRQPGANSQTGNCNLGYQQFNDTYTDGDVMRAARVPDDRIVAEKILSLTEAQHIETLAKKEQDKDSKKRIPLSDVCKSGNSDTKGIQRILKNLINAIEELKKKYNQVSAFASDAQDFAQQVQEKVFYAIEEASSFVKNILQGVRGYVLRFLSDQVKKIAPFLFPSEKPKMDNAVGKGLSLINCLFNKIVSGTKGLLANILSNLLDNFINTPLCAAESLLGNLLDSVLGPITSTLQSIFNTFNSLFGFISGGLDFVGSLFDALEFIPGIAKFFSCDDQQDCVEYNEISQDRSALPGGDAVPTSLSGAPTGSGANASQPVNASITNTQTRLVGNSYTNESGTFKVLRQNIGTELNDDGTPVTFNIVQQIN